MSAYHEMRAFAEAPHQVTSEMLLRWADEVRGLVEVYPLNAPCEYCGDRVVDHTPNELKSCVLDLEARADAPYMQLVAGWWLCRRCNYSGLADPQRPAPRCPECGGATEAQP